MSSLTQSLDSKDSGGGAGKIVSPNIANVMNAIAECLETYGFISASQASFEDEEYLSEPYGELAENLRNELFYKKYQPLFTKIYGKYGIADIWY